MKPHSFGLPLLAWLGCLILSHAEVPAAMLHRETRPCMGTQLTVQFYAPEGPTVKANLEACFAEAERLNRVFSDYLAESELSQINAAPAGKSIRLSVDMGSILQASLRLSELTEGAFDVTMGPLSQLWRKTRDTQQLPSREELQSARAAVGYQYLTLAMQDGGVHLRKQRDGMKLDLGGIAKGYTADRVLEFLKEKGHPSAAVILGGDIRVGERPLEAEAWPLTIRHRVGEEKTVKGFINAAASTSGDLYQFAEVAGHRYSHIIDPKTGLGLEKTVAVTVMAGTATESDALATACCLLSEEKVQQLRERHPQWKIYRSIGNFDDIKPTQATKP